MGAASILIAFHLHHSEMRTSNTIQAYDAHFGSQKSFTIRNSSISFTGSQFYAIYFKVPYFTRNMGKSVIKFIINFRKCQ